MNMSEYIPRLLEQRDRCEITWIEPTPGKNADGSRTDVMITHKATVDSCIKLQRHKTRRPGPRRKLNDALLLEDFLTVNWATPVK